jgi:hypothetical protein
MGQGGVIIPDGVLIEVDGVPPGAGGVPSPLGYEGATGIIVVGGLLVGGVVTTPASAVVVMGGGCVGVCETGRSPASCVVPASLCPASATALSGAAVT